MIKYSLIFFIVGIFGEIICFCVGNSGWEWGGEGVNTHPMIIFF